ncbi:hypothetical protein NE237_032894 [Protea cynaroides]|uniref:Transmembrane protein n=1 Tax=Protea cynaroides TaxID=273540 RepID=A0A9Q0L3Z0_9MAGN|nr:hypothetical protein NE237_032894 [Protea cynaroides]
MSLSQWLLFHLLLIIFSSTAEDSDGNSSIIFTTLGRANYAFDIFSLPTSYTPEHHDEIVHTDGQSVNFNGYFPFPSSSIPSVLCPNQCFLVEGKQRAGRISLYPVLFPSCKVLLIFFFNHSSFLILLRFRQLLLLCFLPPAASLFSGSYCFFVSYLSCAISLFRFHLLIVSFSAKMVFSFFIFIFLIMYSVT